MSEVELLLVNSSDSCTVFKQEVGKGNVEITEKEILTDNTFTL